MELYRGYVRIKGKGDKSKASIDRYNGIRTLPTLEAVKNHIGYSGVLNDTTIVIDFDTEDMSKKALEIITTLKLKCKVIKTTRGIHVYFKTSKKFNCSTKTILACGLMADIKCGVNCPIVLKIDGTVREVLYDTKEYEDIPIYFYPTNQKESTLFNKNEGDRNNALFTYILTLQNNNFDVEQTREIIRFINQHIFESPLDDDEINTILRDEAFKEIKPRFFGGSSGNKFLPQNFAEYLIKEEHICKINGQLHAYKDGVYVSGFDEIEAVMFKHIRNMSSSQRGEVIKTLRILNLDNKDVAPPHYIAFKNGIYDLKENKLNDFDPNIIITNKIPHNYNENAKNDFLDGILNDWASDTEGNYSKEIRLLIEEMLGMSMYRSNDIASSFIIQGGSDNGKSKYYYLLQRILGESNYSSIDLKDLETRFKNISICGKLANIGDDINDEYLPTTSIFKKLVTGETVQLEQKNEKVFDYTNYGKLYFSANKIPRIKDDTGAVVEKRIIIVPFRNEFKSNNPKRDPHLKDKLNDEAVIEYAIKLCVEGIKRVLKNRGFTTCNFTDEAKKEYEISNNNVLQFLCEYPRETIVNQEVAEIYKKYKIFCFTNNRIPKEKTDFSKIINKACNFQTKGSSKRVDGVVTPIQVFREK